MKATPPDALNPQWECPVPTPENLAYYGKRVATRYAGIQRSLLSATPASLPCACAATPAGSFADPIETPEQQEERTRKPLPLKEQLINFLWFWKDWPKD